MDYMVFATRRAAECEAARMRDHGWPEARATRLVGGDGRPVWVVTSRRVRLGDGLPPVLRTDGYVR